MAFTKSLAHRFLSAARSCSSHFRSGASGVVSSSPPPLRHRLFLEQTYGEPKLLRRFLHRSRPTVPPDRVFATGLLSGDFTTTLADRIRSAILPPPLPVERRVTVDDAKKVLRAAQMEAVRARCRLIASSRSSIAYHEFISICREICGHDQAAGIAKSLDESGAFIVFGDVVLLLPDQEVEMISSPGDQNCT